MIRERRGGIRSLTEFRRAAEARAAARTSVDPLDVQRLEHELSVNEIELQLQNEELRAMSVELEQGRDRYFEIYDLAPVGYVTLDFAGFITNANLAAATMLASEQAPLIGRRLSELMSQRNALVLRASQRLAQERRDPVGCEVSLWRPDGGLVRAHLRLKARFTAHGQPDGFLCVLVDVTELRQTQDKLRVEAARATENEAQLREIAEHSEDVLLLREPAGEFSYVSAAFEPIWGRPATDLLADGGLWEEVAHPADRARLARAERSRREGRPYEETFRIRRPDGDARWIRARFFPLGGDPAQRRRAVGIAQDITAQRALAEDLRRAHKMEAVGSMSNAIAHDFGNLLQGIMGCALVAMSSDASAERRKLHLERIIDAVKRGSDLVGGLMAFSRKKPSEPVALRFDEVVRSSATLIERLVGDRIRVDVHTRAPCAVVSADPVQIEQILLNLAANARDAMPNGGTLRFATEELGVGRAGPAPATGRWVRLEVRDDGTGIDERTRARIFEPYFTTKPIGVGTGIGLASVLAVTKSLGGRVDVESEVGVGTTFVFQLPCTDAAPPARAVAVGRSPTFSGRALLVEDNALARTIVRHFLEELGLEVVEAPDVAGALAAADASSIEVCISGVTLSDGTGRKVLCHLRERNPRLPALFLSAHDGDELRKRGLLDGGVPILQQPFGKEELAAKLVALLPAEGGRADLARAVTAPR
jgi:PAS domain S-box-containing protein